jgi:hypothetical protein
MHIYGLIFDSFIGVMPKDRALEIVEGAPIEESDFPAERMMHWVPQELQERFGEVVWSATTGEHLEVKPLQQKAFLSALEEHGFQLESNQALLDQVIECLGELET